MALLRIGGGVGGLVDPIAVGILAAFSARKARFLTVEKTPKPDP